MGGHDLAAWKRVTLNLIRLDPAPRKGGIKARRFIAATSFAEGNVALVVAGDPFGEYGLGGPKRTPRIGSKPSVASEWRVSATTLASCGARPSGWVVAGYLRLQATGQTVLLPGGTMLPSSSTTAGRTVRRASGSLRTSDNSRRSRR